MRLQDSIPRKKDRITHGNLPKVGVFRCKLQKRELIVIVMRNEKESCRFTGNCKKFENVEDTFRQKQKI